MAKKLLHGAEARAALARGVEQLALAVVGTLGPKGTNAIMDRPVGTPAISRDGYSIAYEIDLPCRFENLGAQIVREVSAQTNEIAGDGTTTATALAYALVQAGVPMVAAGHKAVDVVTGMDRGRDAIIAKLKETARPLRTGELRMVASVSATEPALGNMIAEALERVGLEGVVDVEYGLPGEPTRLEVQEGVVFDRGFISHHMATDPSTQSAHLDNPAILLTDFKMPSAAPLVRILEMLKPSGRPLLVIADEIAPEVVAAMMQARHRGDGTVVAINPPEFGHWRKSMMEDLGVMTGARVIARDLGGQIDEVTLDDLGSADSAHIGAQQTTIRGGHGDPEAIEGRRQLVKQLWDNAPQNIERDKFAERLSKLTRGTALILAGGATPVEQKRTGQLLEDSLSAARAAMTEGVVAGGGTALVQAAATLDALIAEAHGGEQEGLRLLQGAIKRPLAIIASNAGADGDEIVARVAGEAPRFGFDAGKGKFGDMFEAGVLDPVKVTYTALENAVSVAKLILTTHVLVVDLPKAPIRRPGRHAAAARRITGVCKPDCAKDPNVSLPLEGPLQNPQNPFGLSWSKPTPS
jgi:chaperonin GroEL